MRSLLQVVPYVGTWIEISNKKTISQVAKVVPYVGTWIEISSIDKYSNKTRVVPYVGTWIEMLMRWHTCRAQMTSFPTWERG